MILGKIESQNPTESHYDRAYLETFQRLEADGIIRPGDILIENTSGSAGISFAWLCSRLGYQAKIIVSQLPIGRIQELRNFGAEIIDVGPGGIPATSQHMKAMMVDFPKQGYQEQRYRTGDYNVFAYEKDGQRICIPNHSANQLTVDAFSQIGKEITNVLPPGVCPDYFVSIIGNWTTTIGISKELRSHFPRIQVVGVESVSSADNFVRKYGEEEYKKRFGNRQRAVSHTSFGGSVPAVSGTPEPKLRFRDLNAVDEIQLVDEEDRDREQAGYNHGKLIVDTIGNTSAEALFAARQLKERNPGATVIVVFYDKADRYFRLEKGGRAEVEWAAGKRLEPFLDMYEATRASVREQLSLPPPGWKQSVAQTPADLPTTLQEAYRLSLGNVVKIMG